MQGGKGKDARVGTRWGGGGHAVTEKGDGKCTGVVENGKGPGEGWEGRAWAEIGGESGREPTGAGYFGNE